MRMFWLALCLLASVAVGEHIAAADQQRVGEQSVLQTRDSTGARNGTLCYAGAVYGSCNETSDAVREALRQRGIAPAFPLSELSNGAATSNSGASAVAGANHESVSDVNLVTGPKPLPADLQAGLVAVVQRFVAQRQATVVNNIKEMVEAALIREDMEAAAARRSHHHHSHHQQQQRHHHTASSSTTSSSPTSSTTPSSSSSHTPAASLIQLSSSATAAPTEQQQQQQQRGRRILKLQPLDAMPWIPGRKAAVRNTIERLQREVAGIQRQLQLEQMKHSMLLEKLRSPAMQDFRAGLLAGKITLQTQRPPLRRLDKRQEARQLALEEQRRTGDDETTVKEVKEGKNGAPPPPPQPSAAQDTTAPAAAASPFPPAAVPAPSL